MTSQTDQVINIHQSIDYQQQMSLQLTLQQKASLDLYLISKRERVLRKVIESWKQYCEEIESRNRELNWQAIEHYKIILTKKSLRTWRQQLINNKKKQELFKVKLILFYSKYLKKKYFDQIRKYQESGDKNKQKQLEMMIIKNKNNLLRQCYFAWKNQSNKNMQKLQRLIKLLNFVLMRKIQSVQVIHSRKQLPPKPPSFMHTPKKQIIPTQTHLFSFQRRYTPVKTLPNRTGTTPQKSKQKKYQKKPKPSVQHQRSKSTIRGEQTKLIHLTKVLFIKRVEYQFFNDPLFQQQKYKRYQDKLKYQIVEICNEIQSVSRRQLHSN